MRLTIMCRAGNEARATACTALLRYYFPCSVVVEKKVHVPLHLQHSTLHDIWQWNLLWYAYMYGGIVVDENCWVTSDMKSFFEYMRRENKSILYNPLCIISSTPKNILILEYLATLKWRKSKVGILLDDAFTLHSPYSIGYVFPRRIHFTKNPTVLLVSVNLGNYDPPQTHVKQTYVHETCLITSDNRVPEGRQNFEKSKKYRMLGFDIGRDYDLVVYIDSNISLQNPNFIENLVEHHKQHAWDMYMTKHNTRSTSLEELQEIKKDNYTINDKFYQGSHDWLTTMASQCKEQLHWCGFNALWTKSPRKHLVQMMFDEWWKLIRNDPCGRSNDQISFPIVYEKFRYHIAFHSAESIYKWGPDSEILIVAHSN